MLKINRDDLTEEQKDRIKDLVRAGVVEIVRTDEVERYKQAGVIKSIHDLKQIIKDAETILVHRCNHRCLRAVGNGKFQCRKVNNLKISSDNTKHTYKSLPNDYSIECINRLREVGLVEDIIVNEFGHASPFKSCNGFFHPKRHIPPTNPNGDLNMSPVEGYTFTICRSMQNIQILTECGGVHKYVVKYIGKIDEQNYVIVYADGKRNGCLITKGTFLHNTKISSSKYNEDKARNSKRENFHAQGRAISLMEMLHLMLKYPEVITDLRFVNIPTTTLETRLVNRIKRKSSVEDGAYVGVIADDVRRELGLASWRQMTDNEILVLKDHWNYNMAIDKITQFSIRPCEFRSIINEVWMYYRWFVIMDKEMTDEDMMSKLSVDVMLSRWVDGLRRCVKVRKKALPEIMKYIESINMTDYEDNVEAVSSMRSVFEAVNECLTDSSSFSPDFVEHVESNIIFNDDTDAHLPIPVFSFIKPTMGVHFLLHILLSMGKFATEIDLTLHADLRDSFRYAKLIGLDDDETSLKKYSNELLRRYIEDQLVYYPNGKSVIDSWICAAGDIFDAVIIHNEIPISNMPPVQQSILFGSLAEKDIQYLKDTKKNVITAALSELSDAIVSCSIPSSEELENASKESPLEWDAMGEYGRGFFQPIQSFNEQTLAIQTCVNAIDRYCNVLNSNFVKCITILGYAGCGKSWTMMYCMLYAISRGLYVITTSMMARRSISLGGKHLHHVFMIPTENNLSIHRKAESAIDRVTKHPEKLNLLKKLDILFLDEIGQLSAEMLSVLDMILRKVRDNNIFMGGILVISTMDHTQLQPVQGRPFLLSSNTVSCFNMVKLKTSVRAAGDPSFQRIQEIARMHYSEYQNNPSLLAEFRELVSNSCTFVDSWSDPQITPSTYRLYGKRFPAIEATNQFVDGVRQNIQVANIREKIACDLEKNRFSHVDMIPATESTKTTLDRRVKEPRTLLFFKGAVYEFTYNNEGKFSQSQMAILVDLPSQEDLDRNKKINVLAAPPGLNDIEYDPSLSKSDYIAKGFVEVYVGMAPIRKHFMRGDIQAERRQYGLKHRVTSTIHAAMGDTLNRVAMKILRDDSNFKLWDKAQVIVALTRTKLARNLIFVGDKNDTLDALVFLLQRRSQWTDYMESVLRLVTINVDDEVNEGNERAMNQNSFPFRVCDVTLPQCNTGFVYFIISIRRLNFTYIGETHCIRQRIQQHNSGYGSSSTSPSHLRPYAVMAYICGFNGQKQLRRHIEFKWKEKRDFLSLRGISDPREWAEAGTDVISDVIEEQKFSIEKSDLRLVLLFKR